MSRVEDDWKFSTAMLKKEIQNWKDRHHNISLDCLKAQTLYNSIDVQHGDMIKKQEIEVGLSRHNILFSIYDMCVLLGIV